MSSDDMMHFFSMLEKSKVNSFCDSLLTSIEEIKPYVIGCKSAALVLMMEAEIRSFKDSYGIMNE